MVACRVVARARNGASRKDVRLRQGFGATALKAFGAGGKGIRTPDFQLAKLALYQLSYAPMISLKSLCRFDLSHAGRFVNLVVVTDI